MIFIYGNFANFDMFFPHKNVEFWPFSFQNFTKVKTIVPKER